MRIIPPSGKANCQDKCAVWQA